MWDIGRVLMDVEFALFLYVCIPVLFFALASFLYSKRDALWARVRSRLLAFHCVKCGRVYGVYVKEVSQEPCPDCQKQNAPLSF